MPNALATRRPRSASAAAGSTPAGRPPASGGDRRRPGLPGRRAIDNLTGPTECELAQAAVDALWAEYKAHGSRAARDGLILHYAPLVKDVATRARVSLPRHLEHCDLASYGVFGLIDSIEKFDPGRGVKFATYASPRIRGAIIDELRAVDWVPRSVRSMANEVERAQGKLTGELRRAPDRVELASELGVSEHDLDRAQAQISSASLAALDHVISGPDGSTTTLGDRLADPTSDPATAFESTDLLQSVFEAIGRTQRRARDILIMSIIEQRTMAEIGEALGVTESRVSQIRTKALREVREAVEGVHGRRRADASRAGVWSVKVPA